MSDVIMITVTTRNDVVVIVGNNEGHLYDNQIVI